jgi:ubiquinone/menaquinone biosynthesis C-methylase UbiE
MIDRRRLLAATTAAVAGVLPTLRAYAAEMDPAAWPRGSIGRLKRLPNLDLEAREDFLTNFRGWVNKDFQKAAGARALVVLKNAGIDPAADLPFQKVGELMSKDPILMESSQAWLTTQNLMWKELQNEFHSREDLHLSEMEAADKAGPGTLALYPTMFVPDYTKHEIHIQPGGYVGDAFAGHIYHYGTNNFFTGHNNQDEMHARLAAAVAKPADGKIKRILDLGCSCGQLVVALKERFPEAEVWGVDIGAPMVRYAHMRARNLKSEVHFAQRLAEDTGFPDNHFDVVTSNIMFHEVTAEAARAIVKETNRVLRPGGVFYPIDFYTSVEPPKAAYAKFRSWWDHRWNNEVWRLEYTALDFADALRKADLAVGMGPPSREGGKANILGTKQA